MRALTAVLVLVGLLSLLTVSHGCNPMVAEVAGTALPKNWKNVCFLRTTSDIPVAQKCESLGGFTESYVTFICESLDEHRLVLCCPKGEPLGDFTKSYVAHFWFFGWTQVCLVLPKMWAIRWIYRVLCCPFVSLQMHTGESCAWFSKCEPSGDFTESYVAHLQGWAPRSFTFWMHCSFAFF